MAPKSERNLPPARRGKRVTQGVYLLVAAGFIVLSTWEVERQVFGAPVATHATEQSCNYAIAAFDEAVTRGLAQAALQHTRGKSEEAFEDAVTTSLTSVEKHCTGPNDIGAFLAATRLRDAAEASVDTQQAALAPLRKALEVRRNP